MNFPLLPELSRCLSADFIGLLFYVFPFVFFYCFCCRTQLLLNRDYQSIPCLCSADNEPSSQSNPRRPVKTGSWIHFPQLQTISSKTNLTPQWDWPASLTIYISPFNSNVAMLSRCVHTRVELVKWPSRQCRWFHFHNFPPKLWTRFVFGKVWLDRPNKWNIPSHGLWDHLGTWFYCVTGAPLSRDKSLGARGASLHSTAGGCFILFRHQAAKQSWSHFLWKSVTGCLVWEP